jgi:murein DD-endopeptidase MepM/ murein hydrolase activator NlpD
VNCAPCGTPLDFLRARYFAVRDGRLVPFCSPECKARADEPRTPTLRMPRIEGRRATRAWRLVAAATPIVVAGGVLLGARISFDGRTATAALPVRVDPPAPAAVEPEPEPLYGPELPPPDFFVESERWVHPLPGPLRRLPERPSRKFGVGRDHDSPESCGSGHCGVDIGEVRGEPVLAVHDGTVERVVREPKDGSGRYVRLLHYGGRIVTQYMHLDEVEQQLKPGVHVRAGDKLGVVGDTGTHNSGPHLHFTFATRGGENQPEVYVDPLALLTVWPLAQR